MSELGYKTVEATPAIPATETTPEISAIMGQKHQGYIKSYLIGDNGNTIMNKTDKREKYLGKDILVELHLEYMELLKTLNPKVVFVNTLA